MEFSKAQKIISIGVVLIILGTFMYYIRNNNSLNNVVKTSNTSSTTSETLTNNNASYTIEQVPVTQGKTIQVPDLNRKLLILDSLNYSDEVKNSITAKVLSLQSDIKKDTNNLSKWIDLGLYQKMAGDYEGAKQSWIYVSQKSTTDFVALGNLGYLYAYYFKDNGMAETYYKQAIKRDPKQIYLYIQLAEVYRDVFSDLDKARSIIEEGLSKNNADQTLLEFKNNLK